MDISRHQDIKGCGKLICRRKREIMLFLWLGVSCKGKWCEEKREEVTGGSGPSKWRAYDCVSRPGTLHGDSVVTGF